MRRLQTSEETTKWWTECCQELFNKTDTNVNAELTNLGEISPNKIQTQSMINS